MEERNVQTKWQIAIKSLVSAQFKHEIKYLVKVGFSLRRKFSVFTY